MCCYVNLFSIKGDVCLRGSLRGSQIMGDDVHVCLVASTGVSQKSWDQVYSWGRAKVRQC